MIYIIAASLVLARFPSTKQIQKTDDQRSLAGSVIRASQSQVRVEDYRRIMVKITDDR